MKLTDNEIRDITKHLEAGKSLPDKYRFLLFEDKKEVELVWNGKSGEISNIVLPFQIIEQVDEPRAEEFLQLQPDLFNQQTGRQITGWNNKLIYIDPPFDVGADFSMDIEIGGETLTKKPNVLEEIAYRDTWGKGADSFISMIYERLVLMRDLLAEDGSIYVHCDWRVNSMIRLALDEIFGTNQFRNEIVWQRTGAHNDAGRFGVVHDTLFMYSTSVSNIFNPVFVPHSKEHLETRFNQTEKASGRRFFAGSITAPGSGPERNFRGKSIKPPVELFARKY